MFFIIHSFSLCLAWSFIHFVNKIEEFFHWLFSYGWLSFLLWFQLEWRGSCWLRHIRGIGHCWKWVYIKALACYFLASDLMANYIDFVLFRALGDFVFNRYFWYKCFSGFSFSVVNLMAQNFGEWNFQWEVEFEKVLCWLWLTDFSVITVRWISHWFLLLFIRSIPLDEALHDASPSAFRLVLLQVCCYALQVWRYLSMLLDVIA